MYILTSGLTINNILRVIILIPDLIIIIITIIIMIIIILVIKDGWFMLFV